MRSVCIRAPLDCVETNCVGVMCSNRTKGTLNSDRQIDVNIPLYRVLNYICVGGME